MRRLAAIWKRLGSSKLVSFNLLLQSPPAPNIEQSYKC